MKIFTSKAFTLIELMIVIAVITIITLGTYIPYTYHQQKVLVKQWAKELSVSLSSARNLAIHGRRDDQAKNLHIGLFFKDINTLQYNSYLLSATWSLNDRTIIKTKKLPRWIQFESIMWTEDIIWEDIIWTEYFFEAITWDVTKRKLQNDDTFNEIDHDNIEKFTLSYMWSTSENLQSKVYYYTRSYISDF